MSTRKPDTKPGDTMESVCFIVKTIVPLIGIAVTAFFAGWVFSLAYGSRS